MWQSCVQLEVNLYIYTRCRAPAPTATSEPLMLMPRDAAVPEQGCET